MVLVFNLLKDEELCVFVEMLFGLQETSEGLAKVNIVHWCAEYR